MKKSRTIN